MKMYSWLFNISPWLLAAFAFIAYSCMDPNADILETTESARATVLTDATAAELAFRWAPIHYQDVDATGTYSEGGKADYITAINYDGDWNALNNWDNLSAYGNTLYAHVYYSVVETATHWFIIYDFFHPRDWTDIFLLYYLDQHENDMEGVLMIVKRDGSTYGSLVAAVTTDHKDFYSYTPSGSALTSGEETVDGTLQMISFNGQNHPVTAQEPKGHGLKAWPDHDIDGDGVIYYPSPTGTAQLPEDNYDTYVEYKLVNIFESGGMWDQRTNTSLFTSATGGMQGDNFTDGGANPPWAWNDGDDGLVETGEIATDPAKLLDNYFDGISEISHLYTSNSYGSDQGGVVTFYEDCNYKGYVVALPAGNYTLSALENYGIINDDLSSVRVESGHSVTLYQNDNYGGTSVSLSASESCLGNENFNDLVSSVKIY